MAKPSIPAAAAWCARCWRGSWRWRALARIWAALTVHGPAPAPPSRSCTAMPSGARCWGRSVTRCCARTAPRRRSRSPLNHEHRAGTFACAGCALPLFSSATKFDSGTGWPSFWQPLPQRRQPAARHHARHAAHEVHCRRCGGHLGHVFDDGPKPTGLRYCMNGVALAVHARQAPDRRAIRTITRVVHVAPIDPLARSTALHRSASALAECCSAPPACWQPSAAWPAAEPAKASARRRPSTSPPARRHARPRSSPAAASGACRACSSTSRA